jgi:dipeptidyl aminopeptidase/acylaminoacyl peptidase
LAKRGEEEHTGLYVIPIAGGEARKLVGLKSSISGYSWRDDGKQLAVLAKQPIDEEEKELKEKGFNAEVYEEDLRPVRVWLYDADFTTEDEPKPLELEGSASEIHFSPDGTQLAVALAPTPLIDDFYMYRRIHIVDAESGEPIRKIDNPGKLGPIRWSPDGKRLAFCSGEDINDPSEGRLMVADVDTGSFGEIMKAYLPNISDIAWVNNDTLMFVAEDGCLSALGTVGADGKDRTLSIEPGTPIFTELSRADDGTVAFAASAPMHPAEVFLYADDQLKRLTDHNPWLADRQLAEQEIVRYQASDGEMVEGVLIYPLDHQADQRYPLILTVHGGPESRVPNGWITSYSYPGQVAAGRGYAVFYPNYRGSTGRGVHFAKAHQSDYGGREFDDLIDGVDHLIDVGLVDENKVGVTGGSYGGFASAWCATRHTKRFAAAVMFVGISNQISKAGTTDIPEEMFLVHSRKRLWTDWQFFLERSPIYYVEQARTPLLILHGKQDTRVHPSQSMELYRNLKQLGKAPVRLVWYPGEGHGNRNAAARLDYSLRLMRWMDHYLKGPGGDPPPAGGLPYQPADASATEAGTD